MLPSVCYLQVYWFSFIFFLVLETVSRLYYMNVKKSYVKQIQVVSNCEPETKTMDLDYDS